MIKFKYLVTSALLYVNNVPHLGHFVSCILPGDVYSRFLRQSGEKVVYIGGTDEHGTPTLVQSQKENITPKELTDKYFKIHKEINEKFNIKNDVFGRTTNPVHYKITQDIYNQIKQNNYFYKKEVEQLYCEKCNRFLPDRYVEGICPLCGAQACRGDQCDKCGKLIDALQLKNPYCITCKSTPVVKKSQHVFFELTKFEDQLKKWIEKGKDWTDNAKNFSLAWIKSGLEDRCVTRDLEWGVPALDLPGKVIYVWFEASIGYISNSKLIGRENWWKDKDTKIVHFIGKDNIPFHAILFPATLLATKDNYTLPYAVVASENLNYEGRQFSKSRGIGVNCLQCLEILPADYWRYYLMSIYPEAKDYDFTWLDFQERINKDLNDTLGNFIHRVFSLTRKFFDCKVPEAELTAKDKKVIKEAQKKFKEATKLLTKIKLKDALKEIIGIARLGNEYLSEEEPWKNKEKQAPVINTCLQLCKILSIALEPFVPETSDKIKKTLGVTTNSWNAAIEPLETGKALNDFVPLFKKIEDKETKEYQERFKGK